MTSDENEDVVWLTHIACEDAELAGFSEEYSLHEDTSAVAQDVFVQLHGESQSVRQQTVLAKLGAVRKLCEHSLRKNMAPERVERSLHRQLLELKRDMTNVSEAPVSSCPDRESETASQHS